jgi:AAA15 family ATPase/GTPase
MLLEFSVGNHLSFRDRKTLSLEATSIKEFSESNVIGTSRRNLLAGAIIYGANSSGKSNLIKAMATMRRLVLTTFSRSSQDDLNIIPFLLQPKRLEEPSSFEAVFIIDDVRYRYGFEVNNRIVISEWLFEATKEKENPLFIRQGDGIEVMESFKEGHDLEEKTRDNVLFISVVDQFNGTTAVKILHWFSNFLVVSGLAHESYRSMTQILLEDEIAKSLLRDFYIGSDLGFDDLRMPQRNPERDEDRTAEEMSEAEYYISRSSPRPKTVHKIFDEMNNFIGTTEFDMRRQESAGTNKIYNISGALFNALRAGGVLVIDELDSSLHPLLTLAITRLFNSKNSNPKGAQLIFATHDTNLLTYGKFRRDQIYFVEKDKYGASDLYSLVEYREEDSSGPPRNDRSFEKDYINGRYGAIPFIGGFEKLVEAWQEK